MSDLILDFSQKYLKLKERDKKNFSRIANKLLSVNFITNQKETDLEDYYFIVGNLDLFKSYLSLMDFELNHYQADKVIMLSNNESYNHFNLKLNESIVLLILRLIYDEKMREVSLTDKIIINLDAIHDKFLSTGLKDRRISKTELRQILSVFKRYNLIELIDTDLGDDESRLILYPSILYAVYIENINEVYKKLSTYRKGGESNEETSSDQTD
ncbi:MAG: hypothetical protein K0Q49_747 [Haloplasmataceae bacterium]|jgi:hypothetical protein|nr:hypothetical protein [Haloplasmataceae bacterium]